MPHIDLEANAPRRASASGRLDDRVRCWTLPNGSPPLFVEAKPRAFEATNDFVTWLTRHRQELDQLIIEHGGVILRGFPIATTEEFAVVVSCFPLFQASYAGGQAARRKLFGPVYEATQLAGVYRLALHQEMFYVAEYPARIAFFAKKLAECGGETIIADMRRLTRELPKSIREKLEAKGVRNIRNFGPATGATFHSGSPEERGWDFAFYTDSKTEVEAICAEKGLQPVWQADGSLTVINRLEAFARHPTTGERIYRAGIHGFGLSGPRRAASPAPATRQPRRDSERKMATSMALGDGTDLEPTEVAQLLELLDSITLVWPWRAGDLMILDNLETAHGRNSYVGSRETEVALLS